MIHYQTEQRVRHKATGRVGVVKYRQKAPWDCYVAISFANGEGGMFWDGELELVKTRAHIKIRIPTLPYLESAVIPLVRRI